MKPFFRWLGWFEFETTLGPCVVWVLATTLCWVAIRSGGLILQLVVVPLWFSSSAAWFFAFIVSITTDHFVRALVQLLLGLLCFCILATIFGRAVDKVYPATAVHQQSFQSPFRAFSAFRG